MPRLGGFNLTFLYLEVRRLVRNRRTVILTLVLPIFMFLAFRGARKVQTGSPTGAASTMIGVAVYGAMLAATSGGALVSVERALGWSRQLRLTPLRPPAYIVIKLLVAMLLGLVSVGVVYIAAAVDGVHMAPSTWLLTGLLAWGTAFVFAAFGLFLGYLLPTENAMQFIGPVLGIFALVGGLLVPLKLLPTPIQNIAPYMPPYGVAQIARFPLVGGTFDLTWVVSVVLWTGAFGVGAIVLFRRDTQRT
ncbi:MAG: ABC transporter permease [Candidatus Dormibacteria bacterium]